jgi:signal transduction histidine kinase
MVAITVSDNGPGIEESVIGKLFKEKITTKTDGHGYGLQICRQVVEHHGGAISVRSRVNEGTVFTIYLPPATLEQSNRTHGAAR